MAQIVEMPKLSDTMVTGRLVSWILEEGDAIGTDKPIAEVETDKATMELECEEEGVLLRKLVPLADTIPVGAPIAIIGSPDDDISGLIQEAEQRRQQAEANAEAQLNAGKKNQSTPPKPHSRQAHQSTASDIPDNKSTPALEAERISPVAKKMAEENGIDTAQLKGTGPSGRITREDVESYLGKIGK